LGSSWQPAEVVEEGRQGQEVVEEGRQGQEVVEEGRQGQEVVEGGPRVMVEVEVDMLRVSDCVPFLSQL